MGLGLSIRPGEGDDSIEKTPEELLRGFDTELTTLVMCGPDEFETAYTRIEDILFQLEKIPEYKVISNQFAEAQQFWTELYHRVRNSSVDREPASQDEIVKALNGYRELYRALKECQPKEN